MSKKKVLLLDGYSLAFRAFYALHSQLNRMKNRNGLHTNALYGFNNMLESIMKKEQPTHALVAFDAGKTTFRHEFYDDYKGGRDSMPSEFAEQIPYIKELIQAYGIETYELPQYEADDIIGTLSTSMEGDPDIEVVIVTGDRDLTQLAADNVRVSITKKGVSELKDYTPKSMMEEFGITPKQVIDMKGLSGDSSDNIPGVTQIGEKTAIKLLKEYHTMEELYDRIDEMNPKAKRTQNLIREKETALLSKKLATIITDSPVEIDLDDLDYPGPDTEALIDLFKELDFKSQLEKLNTDGAFDDLDLDDGTVDYEFVQDIQPEYLGEETALYLEFFEDDYLNANVLLVGWSFEDKVYLADPKVAFQSSVFKDWLENDQIPVKTYDAKATFGALHSHGIDLADISFDLSLASYILTAEDTSGGDLADVADKHFYDGVMSDIAIYGKGKKASVPDDVEKMYDHVARKIKAIDKLSVRLDKELRDNNQDELYYDIELPLAKILSDMEIQGIKVDVDRLDRMKEEFNDTLSGIEEKIYEEAGEEFNINSPKQLRKILFEKMDYPSYKNTPSGEPSTAQDVLEKLRDQAPIVDYILQYRTISKIQSTYVEGLIKEVEPDTHKVHTRYQQTVTRTGRLSSVDPNLQNIPIRTEEGRKIRQAFVPRQEGWKIFAADYSQIELRVLAHMSKDKAMLETYKNDEDIHTTTAMKVFDIENAEDVSPNMRRDAKAVNFGIVYGISAYGLSQNLNISRKEAEEFIETYFERFPDVEEFMERTKREAKETEYVETIFNRRRYLPDINSRNYNVRSFAERTAVNTPIQGSAADIIKVAMIQMADRLKQEELEATMLLQVHDELIFEAPEEELEKLEAIVSDVMENAVDLNVPLKVDSSSGDTWYDAK